MSIILYIIITDVLCWYALCYEWVNNTNFIITPTSMVEIPYWQRGDRGAVIDNKK